MVKFYWGGGKRPPSPPPVRQCMRASGASELRKFGLLHSKLLFPSIFFLVLHILCLKNIFNFRCQITSAYIHSMQFPFITYGMVLYINDSIPTHTNIEQFMYVYASELRKCWPFYILKLLFLSIFCRYIRYFVGTLMTCLSAYMYRQISKCTDKTPKKHYGGGGGGQATLMIHFPDPLPSLRSFSTHLKPAAFP